MPGRKLTDAQVARRNAEIRRLILSGSIQRHDVPRLFGLAPSATAEILGPTLPLRFGLKRTRSQAIYLAEILSRHRFYDALYPPFPVVTA